MAQQMNNIRDLAKSVWKSLLPFVLGAGGVMSNREPAVAGRWSITEVSGQTYSRCPVDRNI